MSSQERRRKASPSGRKSPLGRFQAASEANPCSCVGSSGSLGNTFRTGPRMIPMTMRKMKNGIPVFLKKRSPKKPTIKMAAMTVKTNVASSINHASTDRQWFSYLSLWHADFSRFTDAHAEFPCRRIGFTCQPFAPLKALVKKSTQPQKRTGCFRFPLPYRSAPANINSIVSVIQPQQHVGKTFALDKEQPALYHITN
jgi:hypothetical protein